MRGAEQQVHDAQERPLGEQRPQAGERAGAFPLVQGGQLALEALRLPPVARAQRLDLGRDPGHGGLATQRAQRKRGDQQPDRGGEQDDRGGRGQAAGDGGEQVREGEDEVIRGVDRDAEETGHDRRPSSSGRKRAGDGRGQRNG